MAKPKNQEKSLKNLEATKWKPGQSGNPKGRPKGFSQAVQALAWDRMNQLIDITWNQSLAESAEILEDKDMAERILSKGQVTLLAALNDPEQASKVMLSLLDRVLGKPKQEIDWTDKTRKEASGMTNEQLLATLKARGLVIKRQEKAQE